MQVAAFQQELSQANRGVVGIGEEGVLDDHAGSAAGFEHLDKMLEEEEGRFARADGEVLLNLPRSLPPKGGLARITSIAVLFLNVCKVFGERIGVDDVRRLDAMQDHVHDRDDVGEGLLFLAVEGASLEACVRSLVVSLPVAFRYSNASQRKPAEPTGAVVDAVADLRFHDLDDGSDERTRGVILAAVPPGVAHVLDLGFVEMGQLVLLGLRTEAQFVDVVDDLAQVVAAGNLVLDLPEYLPDLVFDGVRPACLLLEAVEVGE